MSLRMEPFRPYRARALLLPDRLAGKLSVVDLVADHVSLLVHGDGTPIHPALEGINGPPFPGDLFVAHEPRPLVLLPSARGFVRSFELRLLNTSGGDLLVQPMLVGQELLSAHGGEKR